MMRAFPLLLLFAASAKRIIHEQQESSVGIRDELSHRGLSTSDIARDFLALLDRALHHDNPAGVVLPATTTAAALQRLHDACVKDFAVMGLGASEESSRSGAVFYACGKGFVVKGGVRENPVDPEWSTFLKMAPQLRERYKAPDSLLSRIVMGFDLYAHHWIAMESAKASIDVKEACPSATEELSFEAFDVKPLPSRAPELSDLLLRLKDVKGLGNFENFGSLKEGLAADLAFLERFKVVDESLFVQVARPVEVGDCVGLKEAFEKEGCAWQVEDGALKAVCVKVLDYLLELNFAKALQSALQSSRWEKYGEKVSLLLSCAGDISDDNCWEYQDVANEAWLRLRKERFAGSADLQQEAEAKERTLMCCCGVKASGGMVTDETSCAWEPRSCAEGMRHVAVKDGGCLREEQGELRLSA